MPFSDPEDKFKVVETEVFEDETFFDDKKYDAEAQVVIPQTQNREEEATKTRSKNRNSAQEKPHRKNKYGWAFFLSSMFMGVGITATLDTPLGIFVGLSIGFLFFVDPIYERIMDAIEGR
ncbi:MAG: hypothetical protein R3C61_01915 [Bacteroidia bacterium]